MTDDVTRKIRDCVEQMLAEHGDHERFDDTESLIESARLDSLAVVKLVSFLETGFGVDFAKIEFDPTRFDSVDEMVAMVEESQSAT